MFCGGIVGNGLACWVISNIKGPKMGKLSTLLKIRGHQQHGSCFVFLVVSAGLISVVLGLECEKVPTLKSGSRLVFKPTVMSLINSLELSASARNVTQDIGMTILFRGIKLMENGSHDHHDAGHGL